LLQPFRRRDDVEVIGRRGRPDRTCRLLERRKDGLTETPLPQLAAGCDERVVNERSTGSSLGGELDCGSNCALARSLDNST
jgi:hypothetical protein